MNREWRDKWVAALRSGNYPQSCGYLRKKEGYCCLGVLCEVVDPTRWADCGGYFTFQNPDHSRNTDVAYLPPDILATTRLPSGEQATLSLMNDNPEEHKSFPEIADWIEAHL